MSLNEWYLCHNMQYCALQNKKRSLSLVDMEVMPLMQEGEPKKRIKINGVALLL